MLLVVLGMSCVCGYRLLCLVCVSLLLLVLLCACCFGVSRYLLMCGVCCFLISFALLFVVRHRWWVGVCCTLLVLFARCCRVR